MSIRKLGIGGFVTVLWVMVLGALALPALAAAPEAPTLTVEEPIHATEATVHGVLNPTKEGEPGTFETGTYQFLYKASNAKVCTGGSVAPLAPGTAAGGGMEAVTEVLPSLTANTEYAVCLEVTTLGGKMTSAPVSFKTALPPEKPTTIKPAAAITATTATLDGTLNPGKAGEAGTYEFTYQVSPSECNPEHVAPEPAGTMTGAAKQGVSVPVTGLQSNQTYTFCLVAINGAGEQAQGVPITFKTLKAPPTVNPPGASGITPFEAHLEASVNPNNEEATKCEFEYGTVAPFKKVNCEQELASLAGGEPLGVGVSVKELTGSTVYHVRLIAENATGKEEAEGTFETLPANAPTIEAEKLPWLFSTEATVEATVNADYQETACGVRYWLANEAESTAVTASCTPTGPALAGSTPVTVTAQLEPLTPGETYDYRVVAANSPGGKTEGPVLSFQALKAPAVTTGAAQEVSATTATVAGTVDPVGAGTFYHVVYATAAQYQPGAGECGSGVPCAYAKGSYTASEYAGAGYAPVTAGPVELQNLTPGTTYHYAILASNSEGSTLGPDQTFTTAAGEATPPAASGETGPAPVTSPFTLPGAFPFVPYTSVAQIQAKQAQEGGSTVTTTTTTPKALTKAQKRAKALKACRRDKTKAKRSKCERKADGKAKR